MTTKNNFLIWLAVILLVIAAITSIVDPLTSKDLNYIFNISTTLAGILILIDGLRSRKK